MVRQLIGRTGYKSDDKKKQTGAQNGARRKIRDHLLSGQIKALYGVHVEAPEHLVDKMIEDPSGDKLDALLCAVQAAWAWTMRNRGYGAPRNTDSLEGWIADPSLNTNA